MVSIMIITRQLQLCTIWYSENERTEWWADAMWRSCCRRCRTGDVSAV